MYLKVHQFIKFDGLLEICNIEMRKHIIGFIMFYKLLIYKNDYIKC